MLKCNVIEKFGKNKEFYNFTTFSPYTPKVSEYAEITSYLSMYNKLFVELYSDDTYSYLICRDTKSVLGYIKYTYVILQEYNTDNIYIVSKDLYPTNNDSIVSKLTFKYNELTPYTKGTEFEDKPFDFIRDTLTCDLCFSCNEFGSNPLIVRFMV